PGSSQGRNSLVSVRIAWVDGGRKTTSVVVVVVCTELVAGLVAGMGAVAEDVRGCVLYSNLLLLASKTGAIVCGVTDVTLVGGAVATAGLAAGTAGVRVVGSEAVDRVVGAALAGGTSPPRSTFGSGLPSW